MANFIQQLKVGNQTYDLYDSEFIVDTRTTSGSALTGVSKASELFDGMQITYWLAYASGTNATLNLTLSNSTSTGAIPCYYNGTTRLGTQYSAGNAIQFVYRTNVTIGGTTINAGWWVSASADLSAYLPLAGGTMAGRVNLPGTPINGVFTGTGTAAYDAGSGVSPRYFPAIWTFNSGFTATDGDIFIIKVPVAGHSNGVYISIDNGANYYPAIVQGTSRLTTHYAVDNYVAFIFESADSAASMYPINGGDDRVTVTGGAFRVFNYYDANTNTLQRTYRSPTNVELPIAGISTAGSSTAAYSAISANSYKDVYAAIPNDTTKIATINPSTGAITIKNLTASQSISTDANKKLVSTNLSVSSATDETTEATRFVHSVTQSAVGKITVKTRPMPTIPNVPSVPATDGSYNLNVSSGTATWVTPNDHILIINGTPTGDLADYPITTDTLWSDYISAIANHDRIILDMPSANMKVELFAQDYAGAYVNTVVMYFNFVMSAALSATEDTSTHTVIFELDQNITTWSAYSDYAAAADEAYRADVVDWSGVENAPEVQPSVGSIILTTSWGGNGPYTQTVTIDDGTANSKIDLQPDATVLSQLMTDGVTAMYVENNNGTFTVYTLGAAPTTALTIQYTRTEVS